ncbi:hypothetical protein [Cupriavidus alkaliphilus]|uniref:Uncharacterized protein n=1 Tax=Cupriavidus alkaliphilus TaxID=942866 RepID=A0A7W4V7Y6_9BURK|nr:hypothetical protein [Cupriavidus alkaliphilus]MBB3006664.1 hypothetical protein [Cupriavidus alkaliphilus]PVY67612.1 hypothetical protein C7414_12343 [Cupriavidus alkaliphilus]
MIENCRSAATATAIALLVMAAGQAHAQRPATPAQPAATDPRPACTGTGLAATAAACRAAEDPGRSKYNLLYADDSPEAVDTVPPAEPARSEQPALHTSQDAPRAGLHGVAAGS